MTARNQDFVVKNGLQVTSNLVVGAYTGTPSSQQINNGAMISGNVGVGTSTVLAGTKLQVTNGNLRISSPNTGILFANGSFQSVAAYSYGTQGTIQFAGLSNTFSGNSAALTWNDSTATLQANNIAITGATAAISFGTGALTTVGGASIGGNLFIGGNFTVGGQVNFANVGGIQNLVVTSLVSNTFVQAATTITGNNIVANVNLGVGTTVTNYPIDVYGNIHIGNTATTSGLVFPDGSFQTTAATNTPSYGAPGTVQIAGSANAFSGNSDNFFWDTANTQLNVNKLQVNNTAIVNSINSNTNVVATNLQSTGQTTVNTLVSNGAISGTNITGTAGTFTSIQNSGTTTVQRLTSNTNVVATNLQSTGQTTVQNLISNTNVVATNLQSTGTATVATLVSNGAINGTTVTGTAGTFTSIQNSGTTTVQSLNSNTNVVATNIQSTGQATVATLVSNGAITATTITGTAASFTSLQNSGTTTVQNLNSNTNVVATNLQSTGQTTVQSLVVNTNITTSTLNSTGVAQVNSLTSNTNITSQTGIFTANVGIGTTVLYTGDALRVVNGNINVAVSGTGIIFPDGSFQQSSAGSSAAGTDKTVQFNDGGLFAGQNNFIFDKTNIRLGIGTTNLTNSLMVYSATPALFNTTNGADQQIIVGNTATDGIVLGFNSSSGTGVNVYGYLSAVGAASKNISVTKTGTGIGGITSPKNTLDVGGGSAIGFAYAGVFSAPSNGLIVQGSIGVGSSVPINKLDILGSGSFTGAVNIGGTASVNALVSNSDVKTATVNASSTIVGQNIYSNGFVQAAGTVTAQAVASNTTITAGTGLTVTSGGMSVTGTSSFTGNVNVSGNLNVAGSINSTQSNILVVQDPLIYVGQNNPSDLYDLGIVGAYTEGSYYNTGIVRNHNDNFWTVFDTLTATPNVITGNIDWSDSTLTYGPFKAGNISIVGTTASTDITNGALVITGSGGVGIGGRLNVGGSAWFAGAVNAGGTAIVNALISNTTINGGVTTVTTFQSNGATVNSLNSNTNVVATNLQSTGTASVASLVSNGSIAGTTINGTAGTFTSLQSSSTATVNALVSNGAISGTTGTFTSALYGGSFNTAGTATVNSLVSNNAVSGTNGTFTGTLYAGNFNSAGTATVNALVSNGAITGTTVNGTAGTFTSIQNSGTTTVQSLNSNTNVVATNLQSTGTASVASLVSNGAVSGTTGTFTGVLYGGSFNTAGTATVNALVSNGAISGTTITGTAGTFTSLQSSGATTVQSLNSNTNVVATNLQSTGTATVAALTSNGAVSGTTGTFTGALYGANFNTAGTATVNALVSNGAISGTTITGTSATLTSLQVSGSATVNALIANVYGVFGQNVTVNSANASTSTTTGALVVAGGIGLGGNVYAGGNVVADSFQPTSSSIPPTGLYLSSADTLGFSTSATERVRITSTGTVGINTTGINSQFQVYSTSIGVPAAIIQKSTQENSLTVISGGSAGIVDVITARTIGNGGTGRGAALLLEQPSGTGSYIAAARLSGVDSGFTIQTGAAGSLSERVRVDSNGNVGVGGTATDSKMAVIGSGANNSKMLSITANGVGGGAAQQFYGAYVAVGSNNNANIAYATFSQLSSWNDGGATTSGYAGYFNNVGTTYGGGYGIWAETAQTNTNGPGIAYAGYLRVRDASTAGTLGASYGLKIESLSASGSSAYGLDISTVAGATNVYPINISHASVVRLRMDGTGNVGIGSAVSIAGSVFVRDLTVNAAIQTSGTLTVNALISNVYGRFGQNVTVNSTNTSTSTTTGALTVAGGVGIAGALHAGGLIYGASTLNIAGAAQVNSLNSNTNVVATNLQSTGQATVASLVSNGAISGTTVNGTSGTFTSIQNSGTTTVQSLNSNTNVVATNLQSTGLASVASLNVNAGVTAQTLTTSGAAIVSSLTSNGIVQSAGALTAASITSNAGISGSSATIANNLYSGTANINGALQAGSIASNGAVSGTTGTFTGALYGGNFNTTGTATVNALVSNTDVKTATVNASSTIVGANLYSNGFVQAAGTVTAQAITSNTTITASTGLTVTTGGITATGTSSFTGNVNITGNVNVTGSINSTQSNILVVQDPLIYMGQNNPSDLYDLGIVGAYTEGSYYNTGIVRNHNDNFWTVFDTLTSTPNVITGNIDWSDSTLTYGPLKAGNIVIMGNTASTGTTSGALIINGTGGFGVGGRINVGGNAWFAGAVNAGGTAIVNALISNTTINGGVTTVTTFQSNGATVNSLNSNTNVVATNLQSTGQATVASLVSNGAISGTTINGTAATVTSLQNSGTETVNALVSNVYGRFGQNVTVNSTNASTSTTTGAIVTAGGVGAAGALHVGGLIYGASTLNIAGAAQVNSLISNGAITGTALTVTSIQNSGLTRTANIVSNTWIHATQNLTVASSNASTTTGTGALVVSGGVGIAGNINAGGSNNLFTNKVGIGTSSANGGTSNVIAVYGSENLFGNLVIANTAAGGSGLYFPDGSFQQTASAVGGVNQSVQFNDNGIFGGTTDFIYDKTNFRLGIGTSSLTNSLSIFSATAALFNTTNGADQQIIVGNAAAYGAVLGFNSSSGSGINTYGYFSAAGAAAKNISVTKTGTGIGGVTIPQNTLEIGGTTIIGTSYSGNNSFINPPGNGLAVQGSVGIGTFTPASTLDVRGNGAFTGVVNIGGTATVNALVSNVYGRFGQNVTVNSTNASTTSASGALIVAGGAGVAGRLNVGDASWFANTLNAGGAFIANSINSNTNVVGTNIQSTDTATVNALVSNTDVKTATVNASSTIVGTGITSNGAIQSAGVATLNALTVNTSASFNGAVVINSTANSTSTGSGALTVAGGVGILGNLYVGGNIVGIGSVATFSGNAGVFYGDANGFGALYAGITSFTTLPNTVLQMAASTNSYAQVNFENTFGGNQSTTDYVATANNGSDTTYYVDLGIAGDGYDNTSPNNSLGTSLFANDSYLYAQGNTAAQGGGNLVIGTNIATKRIQFIAGGHDDANVAMSISEFNVNVRVATSSTNTATGALTVAGGTGIAGALHVGGLIYGASTLNIAGAAQVNSLISNGAVSGTTGTFTSLQNSGTTTTNALVSNVYGRFGQNVTVNSTNVSTSTSTGALIIAGGTGIAGAVHVGGLIYGASTLNIAGAAQVNSLVSNGAINGTTITGTATTVTSLQNSGATLVQSLNSNTNVVATNIQSTGQASVASLVSNGAISGTTINGTVTTVTTFQSNAATVNSLNSNTNVVATNLQSTGQATVASLVSNGAVSGTTGTFTGTLYGGSFNTAGTATVNALVSNGAITGTSFTVTSIQSSGTATVNALVSNVYGVFGQNVTVNSTNASISTTTGAIITLGGVGVAGNINTGGSQNTFTGNVGIGTTTVGTGYKLQVVGAFAATTKSFLIDHPTKPGKLLRYGSLEGPENGVYVRGRITNNTVIALPDYWSALVDEATITVNLTPIGNSRTPRIDRIENNTVYLKKPLVGALDCYFVVFGERKDVGKLDVEI